MTWEELKEKAKKMGYYEETGMPWECFAKDSAYHKMSFCKNGDIEYNDDYIIAFDRTPEQMLAIMKALR